MEKTPNNFDTDNIGRQAKYLGLLENVKVRRAGYAHRSLFDRFLRRYAMLNSDVLLGRVRGDARQQCAHLCQSLGWAEKREFALGRTKIFIQDASTLFVLEDMLERKLNNACIVVQKAWRRYKDKRFFLEIRADTHDTLGGRKERRRGSIDSLYRGDYLNFTYDKMIIGLLSTAATREKLLFADRGYAVQLLPKAGFFSSLFGKKDDPEETLHRFLVLSNQALYSVRFEREPLDPQQPQGPSQTVVKVYFRVPIGQIAHLVLSPYADNGIAFHFGPETGVTDALYMCRHKNELAGLLATQMKALGRMADIRFSADDQLCINHEKQRFIQVRYVRNDIVDPSTNGMITRPKSTMIEINSPAGTPGSSVPQPFRPAKIDHSISVRPQLRALHDFPGNGLDELGFRAGDIINVSKDEVDGWYEGELNGKKGFVPATYVERLKRQNAIVQQARPGAGKTMGARPQAGAAAAAPKKCDWTEQKTEDGNTYFWNRFVNILLLPHSLANDLCLIQCHGRISVG